MTARPGRDPLSNGEAVRAPIESQHYAFLVDDETFDAISERLKARGVDYYADPGCHRRGEINHNDGGRGTYFADPDGHLMEILTVPYGG